MIERHITTTLTELVEANKPRRRAYRAATGGENDSCTRYR